MKRNKVSKFTIAAIAASFLVSSPSFIAAKHGNAAPVVLKVSEEVKPGETISIYGENLTSALNTHVYLAERGNRDLTIRQYDPEGHVLRVTLPSDVQAGAYTLKIRNDDGTAEVEVNKADPSWISDKAAYAGMQLKLMGRNLDASKFGDDTDSRVRLVLVNKEKKPDTDAKENNGQGSNGHDIETAVNSITPFDVTFTVPSNGLDEGSDYYVEVNTNAGSTSVGTSWARLKNDDGSDFRLLYKGSAPTDPLALNLGVSWSKDFNWEQVKNAKTDFGAQGDGSTDDLNALQSGIDWLNEHGGGVLYIPNGTYILNGILNNKTGVILKGESRDATILKHTGPTRNAFNAPYESLMGIADLKITLDENDMENDDGFIFFDSYGDPWATTEPNLKSDRMFFYNVWTDNALSSNKVHVHYIIGGKENVLWANNKLYGRGAVIYSVWLRQYATVRNNTFDYSIFYNNFSTSKSLFLNNTITGHFVPGVSESPIGIHGFANNPAQGWALKHLYFDANVISNMGQGIETGNVDGEVIQAEAPAAQLMMGPVTAATPNTVSFLREFDLNRDWNESWQALIVKGKGLGQLRNITGLADNGDGTATATLEKNWDVQPDTTSKVVIRRMIEDIVISRTDASDSSWGLVFYNVVINGVIADNTLSHTQGAQAVGYVNPDNLVSPTYFNQLKRNTTAGKSTGPSQFAAKGHECTWIGAPIEELDFYGPGTDYYAVSNYATEIKDNSIDRYDCSSVADWATWKYGATIPLNNRNYDELLPTTGLGTIGVLVEGNDMKNSDYGIYLGKNAGTTFITRNTYENILIDPIVDDGSTNTVIYRDGT